MTTRSFPSSLTLMAFGYKETPNFTVRNKTEIAKPPKVEFGSAPDQPPSEAKGVTK